MDTETRQRLDSMQAQINKLNRDVARLTETLERVRRTASSANDPRNWGGDAARGGR